ncbi:MarR family winged helix-turn-helix transcriptional regulator [Actinomycetospora cinnamomea]|uniref:MarR family transcriptional regulator n=1 Tax=Actinomycetospora cinnamomea TaxID=663609 RepID=A0A2U1FSP0_9PSEU|nr:MarR family transcriptional regulator [Actinomycetospora cinnamomea]PVZ15070.1 MarR family transcriptional regulator [Actinomycetospora cinnamomea]
MEEEPRWLDAREQRAWRGYLAMQAQLQATLHRRLQADAGLSLADFDVLVALTDRGGEPVRAGELAALLQWEKSRLSHHLARMERRGLVAREDCPDDARGAFVVLTAAGRRAQEAAAPAHVAAVRELVFDGLTSEQVDALIGVTDEVRARIAGR